MAYGWVRSEGLCRDSTQAPLICENRDRKSQQVIKGLGGPLGYPHGTFHPYCGSQRAAKVRNGEFPPSHAALVCMAVYASLFSVTPSITFRSNHAFSMGCSDTALRPWPHPASSAVSSARAPLFCGRDVDPACQTPQLRIQVFLNSK